MNTRIVCPHCGKDAEKPIGAVNRARKISSPVYCSRQCFGLARRLNRSVTERKQMKAKYDAHRRVVLADRIRQQKREYFQRTYDPAKQRKINAARMPQHVEYCRRYYADPQRKRAKVEYDKRRMATMKVGEYAECMLVLNELWKEIRKQEPNWYERAKAKGFLDKLREKKHGRQDSRTT